LSTRNKPHRQRHTWSKSEGWETMYQARRSHKQAEVAILIPDKIGTKTKLIRRGKEGHYILIKETLIRYISYKYICTKCHCNQFHKTNTIEHERIGRSRYNNTE
jgi:hypothetical protein